MAFAVKYRCQFSTIKGREVRVDIEEDGYAGSIIQLTAFGSDALIIKYPNAEFDKLTGVRESFMELSVCSSSAISALDFITTSDVQLKVKVYIEDTLEWTGWLDNDQLQETFIDTITEIKLTANDGLSLLKNIQLSNTTEAQIWGIERVREYIGYSLNKTELGLQWYSFINMYPPTVGQRGVNAEFDAFYYAHLTSFTFLTGPRDFDDCFTVLSKILEAFHCTLFQARGAWYIIQLNDRIAGDLDGSRREDAAATPSTTAFTNQSFVFDIGITRDNKLKDADALLSVAKPNKFVNLQYEFKLPPVYFRNFDMRDGTFNAPLSTSARGVYTLDHWTEVVGDSWVGVEVNTTNLAEIQRYILQFPVATFSNAGVQPRARTTPFYVSANDKITFGYSTREKNTGFVNTSQFNYVMLTDGVTTYYLDDDGKWYTAIKAIGYQWAAAEDRRFWKTYSITSDVMPISGAVSFDLTAIGNSRTATNEVHYKDLQFEVIPYVNETLYLKGYEQKNQQAATLKLDYENQIYMSRVDNAAFQGSILDSSYESIPDWKYYSALDATAVPFEKYIARSNWKAVYRNYLKMEINLFNLFTGGRLISLLNTVRFDQIADREFMITTMNSNIINEESQITLIELRRTDNTDDFDEIAATETFRYLTIQQEVLEEIAEQKKPLDWRFGTIGIVFSLLQRRKRRNFNNYK